jgi:hypothetical protein
MKIGRFLATVALGLAAAGGSLSFMSSAGAQVPSLPPELEKLRASLDKYKDPYMAVRDGYLSTVGCVHYPHVGGAGHVPYRAGGMGIHFVNTALIGPVPDPMRPSILVYEPDGDKLRLVAVEWLIPLATGIKERPTVHGQPFDGPMEGHEPLLPKDLHHYDLHAWLWKENPYGVFAPTNPDVKCAGYSHSLAEHAPPVVPHPVERAAQ